MTKGRKHQKQKQHRGARGECDTIITEAERQKITERNQTLSPFLRMPPELRQTIYELVLGNSTYRVNTRGNAFNKTFNGLALLCVCRQIHQETRLLPFTLNTIALASTTDLEAFLNSSITQTMLPEITSLSFKGRVSSHATTYECWTEDPLWYGKFGTRFSNERLKNLKKLHIVLLLHFCICGSIGVDLRREKNEEIGKIEKDIEERIKAANKVVEVGFEVIELDNSDCVGRS